MLFDYGVNLKNPFIESELIINVIEDIKKDSEKTQFPLTTKTLCDFLIERLRNEQYREKFQS